jgi:hypothetical protein
MKKLLIFISLLLAAMFNSYGQWYVKKYQVSDINFLSEQQLNESLENSKKNLLASGIVACMGGCIFLVSQYGSLEPDDNPTFVEQLIGEKGMNKIAEVTGAGLLAGGSIATAGYLVRIGKIRSVINKKFPEVGSLKISPGIILNSHSELYHLGVFISFNF